MTNTSTDFVISHCFFALISQVYEALSSKNWGAQGRLVPEPQKQPETPVETRAAIPAAKVTNNEKAAAASPTKATPAAVKQEQNFLDLPDDQFMQQMQGRL